MNSFAFTCGDINGIGPEIVVKTLNKIKPSSKRKLIFLCPQKVFLKTINIVKPNFKFSIVKSLTQNLENGKVTILDIGSANQKYGKPSRESGKISYKAIIEACNLAKENKVDAIITAPISKVAFKKANINFPGHTELLTDFFNVKKYSMLFVSDKMKCGLITIHIPIKNVSKSLTAKKIKNTIDVIINSLKIDFKLKDPKISMLGLNPHAGEEGRIGDEEIKILNPILKEYQGRIVGPFVPDAYFGNKLFRNYDFTIGLYHDQILIPFKLLNFNKGVNFTAGLPIVRTSPDHGTAFDIAGKGIAIPDSMIESFKYAELILNNRKSSLERS
ncbi:MAG: 4-hydroxythreonine-4-phosphate dehydrogenase PdxA [Ignavibacteriae bacterium]|nr:4-hydroxythreonine-4-phosphate dehydrogenase PdxA [Ignavibacteriota bacterium]MCB9209736.1 4-hydroxythreonine-4-phosphate dehydrogenase PdxA [Ignavibacteriales bacterium]MCB9218892.1 4-hydroxythreonine-4-phosphate dehydrogenase PdxA [Ignavibacteriales bacterium]